MASAVCPVHSPLVSILLLNQRARSISLLGPSVTTGRSANGSLGIVWVRVAMFTWTHTEISRSRSPTQTIKGKPTRKHNEINHTEYQHEQSFYLWPESQHRTHAVLNYVYSCSCYFVCSFMFFCRTGIFLLLTWGWHHQHQSNLLCNFNAL